MLSVLHIEQIAVIEEADIVFDRGFNVLTGETGAGKSIVIDAISAILGERAYRDMIRTGAAKASVRAVFRAVPRLPWFADNGIDYEEELLIQRDIFLDGRNVCRVNGQPVSVSVLRRLGLQLINIHGQRDSQQLFDEGYHLQYLDAYVGNQELLADYSGKYQAVTEQQQQIRRLTMDEGEKLRKMEALRFQIEEISRAGLKAGEEEGLEARRRLLQNAEKLSQGLDDAVAGLYGDEDSDGAAALLTQAERALAKLLRFDDSLGPLHSRVADLMYQTQDVAEELQDRRRALDYSGGELEAIESRLDTIHRLRRKYGRDTREILAYLDKAQGELDEIQFADDQLVRLQEKLKQAEAEAWAAAETLRQARQAGAVELARRIQEELRQLDMPRAQFQCVFTETPLTPTGADGVAFAMSANVGEAMKPLNKVASGGELARIMLALKNVLAQQDQVDTLIFDEVDTGVSGRAAQKVAEKLRSVAKTKQVLCVTHLPQIAALADTHLRIAKGERDGRTYTTVTPLDWSGRQQELARIIGGAEITQTTLDSAGEMLLAGGVKPPEA